jgi:hypothetical protein
MGIFGQQFKRSGESTVLPGTSTPIRGISKRHGKDVSPLAPAKLNTSSLLNNSDTETAHLPHRCWTLLKQQQRRSSTHSSCFNTLTTNADDSYDSIPTTEEWNNENDEVSLLLQKQPSIIESVLESSDGEGFHVTASSVSFPDPIRTPPRASSSPTVSNGKPQKLWKRVSSFKKMNSHRNKEHALINKNKNSKNEIEIQFECFEEDDDDLAFSQHFFSSQQPATQKASKVSLFRRSSVTESWWTQTLGSVKRSIPTRQRSKRTPGTTGANEEDDDSQEQIVFENIHQIGTADSDDGRSSDDDTSAIGNRNWDLDAPIQFRIPITVDSSSWGDYDNYHLNYYDFSVENKTNTFIAPLV